MSLRVVADRQLSAAAAIVAVLPFASPAAGGRAAAAVGAGR